MFLTYQRVSTVEQAEEGSTSIGEQERKAYAVAQVHGAGPYDVSVYADRGVSGSIKLSERPQGQRMLFDMNPGDTIIATKLDRLFRSAADALATAENLKNRGVHLILIDMGTDPVTGNGAAKMFFGMMALVAEFERERINERTDEGRRAKRSKQGYMGGPAPYGYKVEGHGRNAILLPDEAEQGIIDKVRQWAINMPPGFVKREADAAGLVCRSGRQFQIRQLQAIARRAGVEA